MNECLITSSITLLALATCLHFGVYLLRSFRLARLSNVNYELKIPEYISIQYCMSACSQRAKQQQPQQQPDEDEHEMQQPLLVQVL